MTIDFVPEQQSETKPRITVFGIGGAGGNAVNNMISGQLEGVGFVVANTDSQSLVQSLCEQRVRLGVNITHGLGAGARPDIGKVAAEEALDDIQRYLDGNNMVFIAAGMGGGTGTGGAPVIARASREQGILTVGVVTKPFQFEGVQRMRIADLGIQELHQYVDTLIVIPNQNLFRIASDQTTFSDAFKMADDVLHAGVRGVTDLMVNPGLINLDFADIRTVMSEMGKAMMGTGEAEGAGRATEAAEAAVNNPLLDNASIEGAHGVLINITGGTDLTLHEVDEAASRICSDVDANANIIFGTSLDQQLDGRMRVAVIATGIDADEVRAPVPEPSDKVHVLGVSDRKSAAGGGVAPAAPAGVKGEPGESGGGTDIGTPDDPVPADLSEAVSEVSMAAAVGSGIQPSVPSAVQRMPGPAPSQAEASVEPVPAKTEHKTVAANTAGAVAARVAVSESRSRIDRPSPARAMPKTETRPARTDMPADRRPPPVGGRRTETARGREGGNAGDAATARKPTLFERMTGTGRARRDAADGKPRVSDPAPGTRGIASAGAHGMRTAGLEARSGGETAPALGAAGATATDGAPGSLPPADRTSPVTEPRLDPLSSSTVTPGGEEDPLEIPAFLRRQAN